MRHEFYKGVIGNMSYFVEKSNRQAVRKSPLKVLSILLGVLLTMTMFGCGKPKYRLELDGYGFKTKKVEYAEGEEVTVYYDIIATDTDYHFFLDCEDVKLKQDWDNNHGYIFKFLMPAHDVKISVESHNSMEYDPDAYGANTYGIDTAVPDNSVSGDNSLHTDTWFCPECGTKNDMLYCSECGLKKPE